MTFEARTSTSTRIFAENCGALTYSLMLQRCSGPHKPRLPSKVSPTESRQIEDFSVQTSAVTDTSYLTCSLRLLCGAEDYVFRDGYFQNCDSSNPDYQNSDYSNLDIRNLNDFRWLLLTSCLFDWNGGRIIPGSSGAKSDGFDGNSCRAGGWLGLDILPAVRCSAGSRETAR
jgi:hypothetical protein